MEIKIWDETKLAKLHERPFTYGAELWGSQPVVRVWDRKGYFIADLKITGRKSAKTQEVIKNIVALLELKYGN